MKRLLPFLLLLSLFTLTAWTFQDCVEVDFDHPDCDQYVTTTTEVPPSTTSSSTTSTPQQTTSTSSAESTTTSTPSELPTTTVTSSTPIPTTTTTVQECPPGTSHQPPLCVSTTIPFFGTTGVPDTTGVISPPAELPRTGIADVGLLALAGVSLLFLGFTALKYGRRAE